MLRQLRIVLLQVLVGIWTCRFRRWRPLSKRRLLLKMAAPPFPRGWGHSVGSSGLCLFSGPTWSLTQMAHLVLLALAFPQPSFFVSLAASSEGLRFVEVVKGLGGDVPFR